MQHSDILALAGLRVDGRRPEEVRTLSHRFNVSSDLDGSVYYEQGLNKVIAYIHGPREPEKRANLHTEKGSINVQVLNAPFSGSDWKRRRAGDKRNVELENTIQNIFEGVVLLEQYPKSEIRIMVNILESDGSTICAMVNAINLAMMDAGIAMSDMVVACSVGLIKQQLCQDCTQVEQSSGGAYIPVAIKARSEDILLFNLDSRLSADNLEAAIETARRGCGVMKEYCEGAIKAYMGETGYSLVPAAQNA